MIARFIEKELLKELKPGRVVCLFGARRTGKTVLLHSIKKKLKNKKILNLHGQNLTVQEIFSSKRVEIIQKYTAGYDIVLIDEAQDIPNIGLNLKLAVDTLPSLTFLVTGSSAFDLKNKLGEPLVGRSLFLKLYPLSQLELSKKESHLDTLEALETRLIYGSYPQVITSKTDTNRRKILENIRDGYLLKDILKLDNLKDSVFVFDLLRLIAFQIGHDISYLELAQNLNTHPDTVRRYLELLEKVFVIFPRQGFSRNLRKEYTKTPRYYFCDNGIRNMLISNFNPLKLRDDVGALWENYCVSERQKRNTYKNLSTNYYYWRTYDQKEIDSVEERDGKLFGYEMRWGKNRGRTPKDFLSTYVGATYHIVNPENYLNFIT
ncbi:MAG: AAA family ATPase [Patescibacteria group bacterium]